MSDTPDLPNQKIRIREMSIDDLSDVYHIGEEVFTVDYSSALYRTWDEYEVTSLFNTESELCIVAEVEDEIVGFALGTTVNKHHSSWKYGYLLWLGVRPEAQKNQFGKRLFVELKRRMRDQGARMIIIDTGADNEPAINFFRKQGFGNVEKHDYMSLNLTRTRKKREKKA